MPKRTESQTRQSRDRAGKSVGSGVLIEAAGRRAHEIAQGGGVVDDERAVQSGEYGGIESSRSARIRTWTHPVRSSAATGPLEPSGRVPPVSARLASSGVAMAGINERAGLHGHVGDSGREVRTSSPAGSAPVRYHRPECATGP